MENRFERWRQKLNNSLNLNYIYGKIDRLDKNLVKEEDVIILDN